MIPVERQVRCQSATCTTVVDTDHACRFDNGAGKKDTLLCVVCCPNCFGGERHGPTKEAQDNE